VHKVLLEVVLKVPKEVLVAVVLTEFKVLKVMLVSKVLLEVVLKDPKEVLVVVVLTVCKVLKVM